MYHNRNIFFTSICLKHYITHGTTLQLSILKADSLLQAKKQNGDGTRRRDETTQQTRSETLSFYAAPYIRLALGCMYCIPYDI
jgi:hypothetical protein